MVFVKRVTNGTPTKSAHGGILEVAHLLLAQPHSLRYDGFMKWVLIIFIEWVLIIFIIFVIFIIFHQVDINDSQLGSFCSEGEADQLTASKTQAGE